MTFTWPMCAVACACMIIVPICAVAFWLIVRGPVRGLVEDRHLGRARELFRLQHGSAAARDARGALRVEPEPAEPAAQVGRVDGVEPGVLVAVDDALLGVEAVVVALDPFVIVVAAIFGGTLLGIVGALLAIPVAAAGQIGVREFLLYRRGELDRMGGDLTQGLPIDEAGAGEGGAAPT